MKTSPNYISRLHKQKIYIDQIHNWNYRKQRALLERAPLEQMPAILAGEMATDGPRLFNAVVRAIGDETRPGGRLAEAGALEPLAARAGEIAGAGGSADATASAVDVLGEVVWAAVREELRLARSDQIAELAERIGVIVGLVRAAALPRGAGSGWSWRLPRRLLPKRGWPMWGWPKRGRRGRRSPKRRRPKRRRPKRRWPKGRWPKGRWPSAAWSCSHGPHHHRSGDPCGSARLRTSSSARSGPAGGCRCCWPSSRMPSASCRWKPRARRPRLSGALRRHCATPSAARTSSPSESESRAWVIARDTGRPGAQALAERIAEAVRAAPQWRGAPLSVTIGIAVVGEDGHDAPSLIEVAEESRFAAAASGIEIVPPGPPPPEAP